MMTALFCVVHNGEGMHATDTTLVRCATGSNLYVAQHTPPWPSVAQSCASSHGIGMRSTVAAHAPAAVHA
jgi:hypothetical protein